VKPETQATGVVLTERPEPAFAREVEDLGPLTAEAAPQMLRSLTRAVSEAEDALRRAAAAVGASHVVSVEVRLINRFMSVGAVATGRAIRAEPDPGGV